ncbi:MAG TPA: 3'-5' exonuclease, partial [Candidatus Thalassarchaeaceae archaeon]|nr:3'-5' exonuclease [Candidatus Thalassarchaeaceae archaeon]
QEAIMLNDLWIVHQATLGILRQLKSTRGLHDFEDISELAGDLLLSRCPDICRKFYSRPIIDSLNDIDFLRPWSDDHLNRTLSLAHEALEDPTSLGYATHSEAEKALMDLLGRIDLLKRIRRRYLAMILDEAQDINPRQWRLLSRLWGPRHREDNDSVPEQNLEWEPTICYVGDIKQSIYLFRQAQVSTFHRFASHLRRINDQELTTLDIFKEPNPLRTNEWSRDPRALHDTFVRASMHTSDYRRSLNPEVRFDGSDNVHQVSTDEIALRSSGHVRLSINYRTSGGLLRVMDRWWKDVFHHRHRTFSDADWYATEQELKPCSEKAENPGILEWLLPIGPKGENVVPVDPIQPIDPFIHGDGDRKKLESTLIVERIRALIDGSDCTIRTASGEQHYFEEEAPVNPSDIMVLLPSRKYRDSILSGLKGLGIPVQADKEGPLFSRPSVRPLLALVQLCARPHHRHHAAWVARSVLVGLEDDELDRYIRGSNSGTNLIQRLASFAHTKQQAALIQGWERRANSGRIVELLNWTLDHSDLLLAHPMASDRIDAEKFVEFIRFTLQESGGDPVLLADRLARIERDGDGDFAKDMSPSGGVRVMTIHKSKGLQSKVVILADIFGHSQTKLIHENQARLIVTPQMFGVHPKPWLNQSDPISSVWNYIKILHESQVQAEARRLLYVAATRAEERLIVSGSPSGAYFGDSGIELEVEQGTTPCFGSMLLESMRQSSCSNKVKSPWLIGDEIFGTELIDTPRKYELTIDPINVAMNCGLGIDDGIGIRIYHSPECFEERTTAKTVFRSLIDLSETLSDIEKNPPSSPSVNPRQIVMRSNITPSSIDVAQTCMRQYWLKRKIGLKEDINLLDIDSKTEPDTLPPPNVIGTIVHRLVEIGVPSPKRSFDTHPLPIEWTNDTGSSWKDSALEASMGEVFEEYLPSGIDLDQTRKLVSSMISILDTSIFGQFLNEGVGEMGKLDGVRTEMPFGMELEVEGPPFELFTDTPRGKHIHSISEKKIARFSGLIDLVVAFQNSENESSLLPVDLKTEDARILLGSMEKVEGTLLEPVSDEDISEAEKEILMKHRHQLFIYYYALECQEANRASNGMPRRIVEFPAIWVGVSGRLVQMSNEIMSLAESELHPLLSEMIAIDYGVKCDSNSFLCSEAGHHKCHF